MIILLLLLCSCTSHLDIQKGCDFTLSALPYRPTVSKGETREIELSIITKNTYTGTSYTIRTIQTEGTGTLLLNDGRILQDNRSYILTSRTFRIRYIALSSSNHTFTITVSDNLGHSHNLTIALSSP